MKKGDIVRIKSGVDLQEAELYFSPGLKSKAQDFYTVAADATYERVGCADEVEMIVRFTELGNRYAFEAKHFEIVLHAGHPDINKLMEESIQYSAVAQ